LAVAKAKSQYKQQLYENLRTNKRPKNLINPELVRKNLKHSLRKIQRDGEDMNSKLK
jgi:hypothetical protein